MPKPYASGRDWVLYHGDCLEILPSLERGSVDAVVTDPPYSVSVAGAVHKGRPGTGSRNLDFFEGDDDWAAMRGVVVEAVEVSIRAMTDTASAYWWCGHRQFGHVVDAFEARGYSTRPFAWAKQCPPPAPPGAGWSSAMELCVYAYPTGRTWALAPGLHPNVVSADGYRHGQPGKVDHPTQKPLSTMRRPIEASTREGEAVLDPFAGSGTTGVACIQTGRKFIGIEIEKRYCRVTARRLREAEESQALFTHDKPAESPVLIGGE